MTKTEVKVLLDSNVLLSLGDKNLGTRSPIHSLAAQGYQLIVSPQNLVEYYASATRPLATSAGTGRPGKGLLPPDVVSRISDFRRKFVLLDETPNVLEILLDFVQRYRVHGRQTHDCRLAAFCSAHNIPYILTYDQKDFKRFSNHLSVLHPDTIASKGIN